MLPTKKSYSIALVLTLWLGPIGLAYSSIELSIILTLLSLAFLPKIIVLVFCWFGSTLLSFHYVGKYNYKIERELESIEFSNDL
ncbi:hypothetical protein [Aliivibrio sifiae]|uniref:Uncharacterized protein n=1 Tax=Aliivibrio sifiae TaxID=566293 RepID=A0A2S7X6S8_9GAMM|nr:hypothetical protein [Aliivibrio sifiae]PQJ87064.1 hypothetical protein BTO23_13105 [Aliivibrio sifiae]GLR73803.1 hypothetical protein GCM10007855_06770 [Aliivibrio sifiae]